MSGDVVALMLFVAQEGKCFHCTEEFVGKASGGKAHKKARQWTRDHVKLACHGHGSAFNIVLACGPCNYSRGARPPTTEELARAAEIFGRVKIIWASFYGAASPPWPQPFQPQHSRNVEQQATP